MEFPKGIGSRSDMRLQRVGGTRLGETGAPARQGRSPYARGGQLHCGHGPPLRIHDRHGKRPGFPSTWPEGVEPVH